MLTEYMVKAVYTNLFALNLSVVLIQRLRLNHVCLKKNLSVGFKVLPKRLLYLDELCPCPNLQLKTLLLVKELLCFPQDVLQLRQLQEVLL